MIKELLATISPQLRSQLMCAFEQGIEQLVDLDDGTFLAVNMVENTKMEVLEEAGKFMLGRKR